MVVSAVYDKSILVQAAQVEGLTAARVKAVLTAAPPGWLPTLVNHVNEPATWGTGLVEFKAAFGSILGSLPDNEASFLIRVAVAAAGGVSV